MNKITAALVVFGTGPLARRLGARDRPPTTAADTGGTAVLGGTNDSNLAWPENTAIGKCPECKAIWWDGMSAGDRMQWCDHELGCSEFTACE